MARTRQNRNDRPKTSTPSDPNKAIIGVSGIPQHGVPAVGSIEGEPARVWPGVAQAADFRFFIDVVSDKQIEGWILRIKEPSDRCVVVLREGDRILARAIASRFRADLSTAGIGDGQHSFVIPTPPGLVDGEEHLLDIVELESGIRLTPAPIRWRAERAAARRVIDGIGAESSRQASVEVLSAPTDMQPVTGAPRPPVPVEVPVSSAANDVLAPNADFRSLVAFYTHEITFKLAQSRHRSES